MTKYILCLFQIVHILKGAIWFLNIKCFWKIYDVHSELEFMFSNLCPGLFQDFRDTILVGPMMKNKNLRREKNGNLRTAGPFNGMCGTNTRVRMHTRTNDITNKQLSCVPLFCLSVRKKPIARRVCVVGGRRQLTCRDTATGPAAASGASNPNPGETPEHVMEHAWADRPKLHSGIDVQHAITGHTTPGNTLTVASLYTCGVQ